MRQDSSQADGSVAIASAPAGAASAQPDSAVLLPRLELRPPFALPRVRWRAGRRVGHLALATLVLCALAVVLVSTGRPTPLVPASGVSFPSWESGPLHFILGHIALHVRTVDYGFSAVLLMMFAAYAIALTAARTFTMRTIWISIVALHAILLLGPPLQLTDVFNYLGYARLGAVHGLNPYQHGIGTILHDPVYRFSSWHHLHSPYGPLFTAFSYPIALLPIPVAYWVLKLAPVLMSLLFLWLVGRCAQQLDRDPRYAVLFVAANPIYLMYAIGGFHNDFFMLVPSTAALLFLLQGRDRGAGAMVVLAVAVKFTGGLLLPFLLFAARPPKRRRNVLIGAALAAVPMLVLSLALFGPHLPNLRDQSTLLTDWSIPNLFGHLIGAGGGAPWLLKLADVAVVITVVMLLRRRVDWLVGAGWTTFALLASLAWLVPWYVIWLLPLAALATSLPLRRAALAFSLFLIVTFMPATNLFIHDHRINPMGGAAGRASLALQSKLAG